MFDKSSCANQTNKEFADSLKTSFSDLLHYGSNNGSIARLIYYADTHDFFDTHYGEIEESRNEYESSTGEPLPIKGDLKDFMTNNFLRIANLVASNKAIKKTRLMNVLQWNETIKAYNDKKLKKYRNIENSCYWQDMTYGEYKKKKNDPKNNFANKKPKFPKAFGFLDVRTPATNQDYDDVNIRVCINSKICSSRCMSCIIQRLYAKLIIRLLKIHKK